MGGGSRGVGGGLEGPLRRGPHEDLGRGGLPALEGPLPFAGDLYDGRGAAPTTAPPKAGPEPDPRARTRVDADSGEKARPRTEIEKGRPTVFQNTKKCYFFVSVCEIFLRKHNHRKKNLIKLPGRFNCKPPWGALICDKELEKSFRRPFPPICFSRFILFSIWFTQFCRTHNSKRS